MDKVISKYDNDIQSKTDSVVGLKSISHLDISSKTNLDIVSYVRTYQGADEISSLAGVFSSCKVNDWKESKAEFLRKSI